MDTPVQSLETLPPHAQVMQLATGFMPAAAIACAARMRIADLLSAGPRTAVDLSAKCDADPDSLTRVLRALASVGVFRENDDGSFSNTPLSEPLRSDVPDSLRAMVAFVGDEMHHRVYAEIDHSVRTGKAAFDHVYGMPPFEYLPKHPQQAKAFDDAMASHSSIEADAVAAAYDFSGRKVADIGGGNGALLDAILRRYPSAAGVLYDLPHAITHAGERGALPSDRCEFIAGSFFDSVPGGADIYAMKHIIHDWSDDKSVRILSNCRSAMKTRNARVLIVEMILPPPNQPGFARFLDLEMLLIPGGRERTEEEFGRLLSHAGLRLTRVIPTRSEVSLIEAELA